MIKKLFLFVLMTVSSITLNAQSIGLIGVFNGWGGDVTLNTTDNITYTLSNFTLGANSAMKFRQDGAWAINWGAADFPNGVGTQDGVDILGLAGTYNVTFNITTGVYAFTVANSQDGANDSTFNPTDVGFGFGDGPNAKVICTAQQSDGKLIIGGEFTSYNGAPANYITRLNLDGTVDATFNAGTGPNNTVKTIAIQSDGKILIGGSFTNYNGANSQHILRLNTDGTKDTTFVSGPGTIDNDINVIAIAPNGNIAIGGKFLQYLEKFIKE
jgi:uncharacterized delta-60 repeat protein